MNGRRFFVVVVLLSLATACGVNDDEALKPSIVIQWNQATLEAIRKGPARPTVIARQLFLVHTSMYDAWAAYDPVANGTQLGGELRRPAAERSDPNKQIAISYAAYSALTRLFPDYEQQTGAFTARMQALGLPTDTAALANRDHTSPTGIGNLAAEALLQARLNDGSNQANNYAEVLSNTYPVAYQPANSADPVADNAVGGPAFDPARWQPLRVPNGSYADPVTGLPAADNSNPSTYTDQRYLTPHWGAVTPFALSTGGEFRPPPPPRPGSTAPYLDGLGRRVTNDEAYLQQMDEVILLNAQLTERQKVIAEYWADGPDSVTPPGHWNEFAADLSYKYRFGIDEDAKLFFALNGAVLDSSIACWESKRAYDFIRPVSAIQHRFFNSTLQGWAGPGLGTRTIPGSQWRPFQRLTFVTPAFAEYTSGHSTFSAAAAAILARFTGSGEFYDGRTQVPYDRNHDGIGDLVGEYVALPGTLTIEPGLPAQPVALRWSTLKEAADEAGFSRRYGGIHFQDGDLFARRMGEQIGQRVFQRAEEFWRGLR